MFIGKIGQIDFVIGLTVCKCINEDNYIKIGNIRLIFSFRVYLVYLVYPVYPVYLAFLVYLVF